jgi:hypothetical protein
VGELGHALAYWAARWQPLPGLSGTRPAAARDPEAGLDAVPHIPDPRWGIRARLAQLDDLPGWEHVASAVPGAAEDGVATRLAAIVDAAVSRHTAFGYANPVMMVHAATAPNAVLRALPALPDTMAEPSLRAAWAAAAAITAAYAPRVARASPAKSPQWTVEELMRLAADSADEHAIKFADAAVTAYRRGATVDLAGIAASIDQIASD